MDSTDTAAAAAMEAAPPPWPHAPAVTETRASFHGPWGMMNVYCKPSDEACSLRLRGDVILSPRSRKFGPNGWFVEVADPVVMKLDHRIEVFHPAVFTCIEVCRDLIHKMLAEAPATSWCDLAAGNWANSIFTPHHIATDIVRVVGHEICETEPAIVPGYDVDIEIPQLWVFLVCTEINGLLLACKEPAAETVAARVSARRRKRRRGELCAICLLETEEEEAVVRLPCSHPFHTGCIEPWFQRALTCPTCRRHIMQCFSFFR